MSPREYANTVARYHGQARQPCRCEHYAKSLQAQVVSDREERDDETGGQTAMQVIEVVQPGVDTEARWVKKAANQYLTISSIRWSINGLMLAIETTPTNYYDSKPLQDLLDKADIRSETRIHADMAYNSQNIALR